MAESFVQVPADDVGKKIETHEVVDGSGNTVQRQVVEVAEVITLPNVTVAAMPTVTVQDGGGALTIDGTVTANTGLAQPLTDSQLRASDVGASIDDLAAAIYQLLGVLARPVYVNRSTSRMNATVDTVSTVTSVSNLSELGGVDIFPLIQIQYRQRWNEGIGRKIT